MPTESGLEERTASAVESQRSSEALELFLKGATRESTRRFGAWAFERLRGHPEGGVLNMREAARDLGLSRETIRRSLAFYLRFGRLIRTQDYGTRAAPGRPLTYRLHSAYRKADLMATSAKVAYLQPKKSKPKRLGLTDGASNLSDEARREAPVTRRGNPESELNPLQARRRVLGQVRDRVRTYPGLAWPERDLIVSGVAVALAKRWPAGGPAIRRADADAVARAIIGHLDSGGGYAANPRRAHGFGGMAVLEALEAARHAARLRREAERIERQVAERELAVRETIDHDGRLSDAEARDLLGRARRHSEAAPSEANAEARPAVPPAPPDSEEGGPAEPQWARFRPARNSRHPIGDPADLDRRRAELIARLEGVGHGQR